MRRNNILAVWDRMGDYHRARIQALRQELPDRTIFSADLGGTDSLYGWSNTSGLSHVQLSTRPPDKFDFRRVTRFIRMLSSRHIGCVCIAGYGRPEYILFLLYASLTGRRVILFAESWYPSTPVIDKVKSVFLRSCCDGFLVSGIRARNHFNQRLHVGENKIRVGYSVVDNNHFAKTNPSATRRRVLSVARFAPEKNLEALIASFTRSNLPSQGWELVILGDGPLRRALEERSVGKHIALMTWKSYHELPPIYHSAALFVLPSRFEPWGLVVNEAMAASLPVIVSDQVGCLPDLVQEGHTGWSYNVNDPGSLAELFNRVGSSAPGELEAMGSRSLEWIKGYSVELFAANLKTLILQQS